MPEQPPPTAPWHLPGTRVERCRGGRLEDAYPTALHDVELQVVADVAPDELATLLRVAADRVLADDPDCRKVVLALPVSSVGAIGAAESAGFRYVVDVDLPDETGDGTTEVSLLVREPSFVTDVDPDLDVVPTT